MKINLNAKTIAIFTIVTVVVLALFGTTIYFLTSGNDSGDEESAWKAPIDTLFGVQDAETDSTDGSGIIDADVAPEGFIPATEPTTNEGVPETETTSETDSSSPNTVTLDLSEREYPLMKTPTRILVQSALPSSTTYWNADMSGDPNTYVSSNPTYPVLEDAEVRVYQNIPNLDVENYKTTGITGESGYTGYLDLESNSFSEYDDDSGKMYIIVESEHLASNVGKVGLKTSVPEDKYKTIRVKVVPDTYSFSTVLKKQDASTGDEFLSWLTSGGTDDIVIESMRPCAYTSSWGWNLASITNAPKIDVYLSTKSSGDWKQLSFVTTEAVDANNNLHIDIRPQILTAEQGYTGSTKFDMEATGEQTIYIMFDHTYSTDEIYKIDFTVTPSSVTVTGIEQIN